MEKVKRDEGNAMSDFGNTVGDDFERDSLPDKYVERPPVDADAQLLRKAGRAEAAAILMKRVSAEGLEDPRLVEWWISGGQEPELEAYWKEDAVLALFDANDSVMSSLLEQTECAYWEVVGRSSDNEYQLRREIEKLSKRLEAYREAWALTSIHTKQTIFACFDGNPLDVQGLIREDVYAAWGQEPSPQVPSVH